MEDKHMSKRGIQYFTDGKKYVWAQLEGCAFDAINMLEAMSSHQICFHSEEYMMPDKYRVRVECDERDTFDFEKAEEAILRHNKGAVFFPVSAKTNEGMEALADYVYKLVKDYQAK